LNLPKILLLEKQDEIMLKIDLSGHWQVKDSKGKYDISATVPGCVHTDLLDAGVIDDPYYRDNENKLQWISDTKWIYTRDFMISSDICHCKKIELNCQGLDTFSTIKINGRVLARTENMFRDFFFDIKSFLRVGSNTISITFGPVLPYITKMQKQRYLQCGMDFKGSGYVRKEPCNFGWDWGPKLITCGIWKDIEILGYSAGRIKDCLIKQTHTSKKVKLELETAVDKVSARPMSLEVLVKYKGRTVASTICPVRRSKGLVTVEVENPQLWWPNGMGKQSLYDVNIKLKDDQGSCVDEICKRIGLRTLELRQKPDKYGVSFEFVANGKPFFAKGANWIPADSFANRVTEKNYRDLLESAVDANMNMLRVWGGGIYENDVFYDICDQLGLCVWQDFMFACSTYPTYDEKFIQSFSAEAVDNIKRLRHHPSIALWCGNNELEMGLVGDQWSETAMSWADYSSLFDKQLPKVISKHDPQRQYWPSSPHTSTGDRKIHNCPNSGDAHLWDVWHGMEPFEWFYQAKHRFVSEFGFQSFPEPSTVDKYINKQDRNIASLVMDHHQRSLRGNARIMSYMLDWFKMPDGFESTLWLSQILQALCIKTAVEHFRRQMPRCMGTLYWQLNDCWPVASWSSVDYFGRYKALHWAAKRFYAPVLVSAIQQKNGHTAFHLSSDLNEPKTVKLTWELFTKTGQKITSGYEMLKIDPRKSLCVNRVDFSDYITQFGQGELILNIKARSGSKVLSSNTHLFCQPKYMNLQKPNLNVEIRKVDEFSQEAIITTDVPALWVWVKTNDSDAKYSDNFFDVFPGEQQRVLIRYTEKQSKVGASKASICSLMSLS
jgi:beta-mannosidase